MLEVFAIPVLNKAISFLFDEGSKIMQERRDRRKATLESELKRSDANEETTIVTKAAPDSRIAAHKVDDLLKLKVSESAWTNHEAQVQSLLTLLEIHSKNYRLAREQYAKWGSELVPPIILHRLEEAENNLSKTLEELRATLVKVFGKEIAIPQLSEGTA